MKNKLIYLFAMLAAFAGCDKSLHEIPADKPIEKAVVTVSLSTEHISNVPLNDVHLYWFDSEDKLCKQDYFASMEELARARIVLPKGSYTLFAVLNVGENFTVPSARAALPNIDLNTFLEYIERQQEAGSDYDNILTGMLRNVIETDTQLVYIELKSKVDEDKERSVELFLSIPSPRMPDFVSTKATLNNGLRGTAFVFKKGSKELHSTQRTMLAPTTTEGVYSMELSLFKGEYDVNLWVDYTFSDAADNHYITTDPDIIYILPHAEYTADSDMRDGFSKRISLTVQGENGASLNVDMHRPMAKYRLVATDVKKYEALRMQRGYPALEELSVSVNYENFFPNAYSISLSKPADSKTGYSYASALSEREEASVTVGKDYVFVNGTQSFVTVSILFKDGEGKIVSGVKGVKIDYRAGQLTTVNGDFLTSGLNNGVIINTDWSGDYNVEF